MIPDHHIELLRRALPHIKDHQVVEIVVGVLAQGSDYPVPPDISSVEYIDFSALRLCFWQSITAATVYPDVVRQKQSPLIDAHYANLTHYLNVLEQNSCLP